MPIIPQPPLDPTILLNYGQSVDEASLINGIQNKETIQLNVEYGYADAKFKALHGLYTK